MIDWYANGGQNQNWLFLPYGGSNTYEIINVNSNMCLTSDGVAGDQVYQEPCTGSVVHVVQQWQTNLTPSITTLYRQLWPVRNPGPQGGRGRVPVAPWPGRYP